jgi:RimJ/RimL family protein N-acetyltransferase
MDANHQTYGDCGLRTASWPASTERIAETTDTLVLDDGTPLRIRPLERSDRAGLLGLFARLSPESRQRRFLGPKPRLSERELDYFSDIDHVSHEALVAIHPREDAIVGVARYAQFHDEDRVADVAVAVADNVQRMGIGTALTTRLVQRARSNHFNALRAATVWENRPARALMRRLGFRDRARERGELEYELALP